LLSVDDYLGICWTLQTEYDSSISIDKNLVFVKNWKKMDQQLCGKIIVVMGELGYRQQLES
jgi:hypothetical protein